MLPFRAKVLEHCLPTFYNRSVLSQTCPHFQSGVSIWTIHYTHRIFNTLMWGSLRLMITPNMVWEMMLVGYLLQRCSNHKDWRYHRSNCPSTSPHTWHKMCKLLATDFLSLLPLQVKHQRCAHTCLKFPLHTSAGPEPRIEHGHHPI